MSASPPRPEDDPRGAHRRRRRRSAARLRHRGRRRAPRRCRRLRPGTRRAIVNSHETITGDFILNPDLAFPSSALEPRHRRRRRRQGNVDFVDATGLATALLGDSHRHQPVHARLSPSRRAGAVSAAAIERAIELNGVAVDDQPQRLPLGPARRPSTAPPSSAPPPHGAMPASQRLSETLDEVDRARASSS